MWIEHKKKKVMKMDVFLFLTLYMDFPLKLGKVLLHFISFEEFYSNELGKVLG